MKTLDLAAVESAADPAVVRAKLKFTKVSVGGDGFDHLINLIHVHAIHVIDVGIFVATQSRISAHVITPSLGSSRSTDLAGSLEKVATASIL